MSRTKVIMGGDGPSSGLGANRLEFLPKVYYRGRQSIEIPF